MTLTDQELLNLAQSMEQADRENGTSDNAKVITRLRSIVQNSRYFVSEYTDGPATRWNVIDRQTQEWIKRFASKSEAQEYADIKNGLIHGGPTEASPNRPYCKDDQTCCDFCCGN